jgi:TetR/AcrR family transcriptional regulator
MPKDADVNMEQTILDTAERLFLEKGFALTSTTEIAKVAGCNQALIHYYFRTKDKLFEAIFAKKAKIFFADFHGIIEEEDSFEEALARVVEAHFDMIRANPQLPFLIVNELTTNPARIESIKSTIGPMIGGLYSRLESALEEEISAGRIRSVSALDLIVTIVSLNAAVFIGAPIMKQAWGLGDEEFERLLDSRRRSNVEFVLNSLRP